MQNIILLDTEKLGQRGFQHDGPAPTTHTHTHWRNTGGRAGSLMPHPPRVPMPMNLSKHLFTYWLGVSTVELCGWKKRDLGGVLRYVRAQKWGGAETFCPPLPGKSGGEHPLAPPCSYAYVYQLFNFVSNQWKRKSEVLLAPEFQHTFYSLCSCLDQSSRQSRGKEVSQIPQFNLGPKGGNWTQLSTCVTCLPLQPIGWSLIRTCRNTALNSTHQFFKLGKP